MTATSIVYIPEVDIDDVPGPRWQDFVVSDPHLDSVFGPDRLTAWLTLLRPA